jgi:hypothetical protein
LLKSRTFQPAIEALKMQSGTPCCRSGTCPLAKTCTICGLDRVAGEMGLVFAFKSYSLLVQLGRLASTIASERQKCSNFWQIPTSGLPF